jgi:hypothetical protein
MPLTHRGKAGEREAVTRLEQIPNVGPSIAADLRLLGVRAARDLPGRDPFALYEALCAATGVRQDPCVLDVFISAVRFMEGAPARAWWHYTAERKRGRRSPPCGFLPGARPLRR